MVKINWYSHFSRTWKNSTNKTELIIITLFTQENKRFHARDLDLWMIAGYTWSEPSQFKRKWYKGSIKLNGPINIPNLELQNCYFPTSELQYNYFAILSSKLSWNCFRMIISIARAYFETNRVTRITGMMIWKPALKYVYHKALPGWHTIDDAEKLSLESKNKILLTSVNNASMDIYKRLI